MKTKKLIESARICTADEIKGCSGCLYNGEDSCSEKLIKALADRLEKPHKKNKAKKVKVVKLRETEYGTPYRCPVCDADQARVEVISNESKVTPVSYCWYCGQKLKWEVKE